MKSKKTLYQLFLIIIVVLIAVPASATVIAGPFTNPSNGHIYYLLDANTWTEAEAEAETLGGHLVTINNQAENDWVYDTFADIALAQGDQWADFWIGLYQLPGSVEPAEGWVWISGEPATYRNWDIFEPNNSSELEHHALMFGPTAPGRHSPRKWNDVWSIATSPFGVVEVVPISCVGFEPPMASGSVVVKKNRVLPLKAQLLDTGGNNVTDSDIAAFPVLQVLYDSGIGGDPVDVTDDSLPAGQGTDGNQFEFSGDKWHFNLKTKNYSAMGTYNISMISGDGSEYMINPKCEATFVIE